MPISVVIPARNEEKYLPSCLAAIREAATRLSDPVEIVVVINRCTDATERIAREHGCSVVHNDSKNLSCIRNAGVRAATASVVVTIDADSRMSARLLEFIGYHMQNSRVVGGGTMIWPERWSLGIAATMLGILPIALWYQISAGVFFFRREAFDAIGGFDEQRFSAEDIDFARRMRAFGKGKRQRFVTILSAWIVTSCRKFDRFGDWFMISNPRESLRLLRGNDQKSADRIWYDFEN